MGKGRKAISDQAKRMKGTDQPVRMNGNTNVGIPVITKLPPPKNLSATGKKIYRSAGSLLLSLNILNVLNLPQFYQYCKETELYYDIMNEMPTTEELIHDVTDKQGNLTTKVKALRKIAETALGNSKMLAAEFGLTPSAQAKIISHLAPKQKSPLETFLND
jgi:P27 family predicted phage terminase small subunit